MVKNYNQFINEAEAPAPAPVQPAPAPAQPAAQPAAQPQAQPAAQPQAQAQSGTTQGQSTEDKSGDLSNYNSDVTKFPETVKKMADLLKDMDKEQLIKVRNLMAELKSINDAKSEIGKL